MFNEANEKNALDMAMKSIKLLKVWKFSGTPHSWTWTCGVVYLWWWKRCCFVRQRSNSNCWFPMNLDHVVMGGPLAAATSPRGVKCERFLFYALCRVKVVTTVLNLALCFHWAFWHYFCIPYQICSLLVCQHTVHFLPDCANWQLMLSEQGIGKWKWE